MNVPEIVKLPSSAGRMDMVAQPDPSAPEVAVPLRRLSPQIQRSHPYE